MNIEQQIVHRAAQRHGVITSDELRQCGANRQWIARRVAMGWLTPISRGVYLVGADHPSLRADWVAATCEGGTGSMLLGVTGLVVWGHLQEHRAPAMVEVSTRTSRRSRTGRRFVRRTWLARVRPRVVDAIPVAPRWACIATAALHLTESELVRIIDDACFHERSTLRSLDRLLADVCRFPGRLALVRALARLRAGDNGTASEFEAGVTRDLIDLGAPPFLCNAVLLVPGGKPIRVDQYWEDARLVLEDDSGYHTQEHQGVRDRRRDVRLAAVGIDTVRLPASVRGAARTNFLGSVIKRARQHKAGPPVRVRIPER